MDQPTEKIKGISRHFIILTSDLFGCVRGGVLFCFNHLWKSYFSEVVNALPVALSFPLPWIAVHKQPFIPLTPTCACTRTVVMVVSWALGNMLLCLWKAFCLCVRCLCVWVCIGEGWVSEASLAVDCSAD